MNRFPSAEGVRLLCAVLAILAAAACGHRAKAAPAPPYVGTTVASFGTIDPSTQLSGIIAPYENVAVQSTLSEPADAVNVQEGDHVRAGEVIAVLDTADLVAEMNSDIATANSDHANTTHTVFSGSLAISQGVDTVNSDVAALGQAQATLSNDQANLVRDQALLKSGYVSPQTTEQQATLVRNDQQAVSSAQAALAAARSNVQANGTLTSPGLQSSAVQQSAAQEQVALAQAQQIRVSIQKATIYSPVTGVVVNRNLNPGEYPGTRQIFTIQQVDPIYAVLRGSTDQIANIFTGATATISTDATAGDQKFIGTVIGVLNEIQPGSTQFQVKVLLNNPGEKLRPGMAISGTVARPTVRGVRVPVTAFTDDDHDAVQIVQTDDTVKTVTVKELASDGTDSVISGIGSGTRVVSNGQSSVGDGEKVSYTQ